MVEAMRRYSTWQVQQAWVRQDAEACIGPKDGSIPISLKLFISITRRLVSDHRVKAER